MYNLIQNLIVRGHTVDLFIPHNLYSKLKSFPIRKNFNIYPVLFYEDYFIKYFPFPLYLRLLFKQLTSKYDVWQIIGAYPFPFVVQKLSEKVPFVVRSFGEDVQEEETINYGLRLNPFYDKRLKKSLPKMTRLVALTPQIKECYLELGVSPEQVDVIPNAVNLERFNRQVDRKTIRSKYNISDTEILILTIGRYHIKKGYEYIPEAVKILVSKGYNFKWLIVGSGLEKIMSIARQHDVHKAIITIDEIRIENQSGNHEEIAASPSDEILDIYKSADIFVLPSLIEGMSNVLLEAMAAGLPIVTTKAPGCEDIVIHGENGLLAEIGDSGSLAENIRTILDNGNNIIQHMRSNSSNMIKQHRWSNITDQYEKLYTKLVERSV